MHQACGGRRIGTEKLHATLAFLGACPEDRLPGVLAAANEVRAAAFELVIDEACYWKHNRIAWAGASSLPSEVTLLSERLRDALSKSGFAFDPKPFVPHITLVRDASRSRELPRLAPIRWEVKSFALVQSSGGRYTIRSTSPLL